MRLYLSGHDFAYEAENVLRLFCPGVKLEILRDHPDSAEVDDTADYVHSALRGDACICEARIGGRVVRQEEYAAEPQSQERVLAVAMFAALHALTGVRPAWGILTGIRPARLLQNMATAHCDGRLEQAASILERDWLVTPEKAKLALLAAEAGLRAEAGGGDFYSLYISIPFCPTRCRYCSFVSQAVDKSAGLIPRYVELLCAEIDAAARLMRDTGRKLHTIYIGGGTPTTLTAEQLGGIMARISAGFDLTHLREYSVEAGRPDTITREKLDMIKRMGAERISVNPQSLSDAVLANIGRAHSAQQVISAYELARKAGFAHINMDIIAGLDGDTEASFSDTVDGILALAPENITVHSLSVKRSSGLREQPDAFSHTGSSLAQMQTLAAEKLTAAGYAPYYLYRQKASVENLENIGYALPDKACLYNIYSMEETETILGLGAGAVTKLVSPAGIDRVYNYKYPAEYISGFDEIIKRKEQAAGLLSQMAEKEHDNERHR